MLYESQIQVPNLSKNKKISFFTIFFDKKATNP